MTATTADGEAAPLPHAEVRTIIIGVMLAMFLAALDQTIVATALPTIGRALGDFDNLPWVVTAYLVAATAATPLYGKFSDIHGRRITLLIAIVTFIVGSIACAMAPNMLTLIVARAVQGLGGGGLISIAQTVVADVSAPRDRGRYQAYFATVFATSSLAGPVLGGLLAEHLHWSLIFWINVPLGIAAFLMSNAALKQLPRHERRHRLDVLGAVLLGVASIALMLALSWGGVRYAWASPEIAAILAGSALFWALFVLRVLRAEEPLIPIAVLRTAVVLFGTASACFGMGTFIALTIYVPIFFEAVLGMTAGESGLALIPLTVGTVCGATFGGRAISRIVHYRRVPLAGLALAALGCLSLAFFAPVMPFALFEAALVGISFGLGTLLPVSTVAVQNAVAPHQLGTTTATMNFFRQLGGALMVALFGAILLGGTAIGPAAAPDVPAGLAQAADPALALPFRWIFAAAAASFGIAFVLLLFMEEKPLRTAAPPRPAPAA